jgi:DnaK suppressor protein
MLEKRMTTINLEEFRRTLQAKRRELMSNTADRDEIRIENAAEDFDRLQQQMNREVAIRNLDRESTLLKSVQSALARIEDESFGICLRCDEEIPEKRLKALPWAAYCVKCQEIVDRQRASGDYDDEAGSGLLAEMAA